MSLFEASAEGDQAQVERLLKKGGADINAKDDRGWTALHFAARYNHATISMLLIDSGADAAAKNNEGRTSADLALFWGHAELAESIAKKAGLKLSKPPTLSLGGKGKAAGKPLISLKGGEKGKPTISLMKKEPVKIAAKDAKKKPEAESGVAMRIAAGEHVNFFAGCPLKRMSEKRTDKSFLASLLTNSSTRFLLFSNLDPITNKSALAYVSYNDLKDVVDTEARKGRLWCFLGVDPEDMVQVDGNEIGRPYFCVDVTVEKGEKAEAPLEKVLSAAATQGLKFAPFRTSSFRLNRREASIAGLARSILDWNLKNVYCSYCGRPTVSEDAGFRRICLPTTSGKKCLAHRGVQNFSHPRMDPVIIVCLVSPDGQEVMLGRGKTWQKGFFSCIAGFMEPGESIEDTVRREAREEIGVNVGRIVYHSSQPWPMPGQLMMGMIAQVEGSTEFDPEEDELEEARWFSRDSILEALEPKKGKKAEFSLPPQYAIAHQILRAWAHQEVEFPDNTGKAKL